MIDPVVSEIPEGAVVADVRSYLDGRVGRDAYDAGHVPGAVFVDLDEQLAAHTDPAVGGRHPLPTPEALRGRDGVARDRRRRRRRGLRRRGRRDGRAAGVDAARDRP